MFNKIILDTTEKELSSEGAVKEFMDIGGWKARRSEKELNFAKRVFEDKIVNGVLQVETHQTRTDWREWFKTVGRLSFISDNLVSIEYAKKNYIPSQ